ncbi:MAG: 2Fe-2S iron-sulfur cluster-binding protein [Bacteroidota bacterium]|nr:2Fe-2S iron-sulfur cluster-binding protein [Bacteroidota bacterium]MDP4234105.1 2Fe-2S iron-sulfur cluster-binding protein [Bacteroidota bacterium]MDP4243046.1 2Fe-2S iron-sulfur cluster-binding protein [Bacteroidota bacterium]MDP4287472.1 2Fe-2S iron-sulfur cluster-binding protein [Bacteroidota bacterium]
MPKITIDGTEYQARDGQTIIQVATENGIDIPHFCWHPALTVAGNCRMCLVEVEKNPKLQIACATTVADGMNVKVNSPVATKGREDVMEFLLINHPLDCPICDEAGQCKLQDYAFEHSRGVSRFVEEKNHKDKRVAFGPNVLFDGERCISCSRCIRFAQEVAEQPVLTFVNRGDHVTINAVPAEGFDNNMSMNVIDICPVGALTSRDFRFKARVWDMSFTDSICPGCSRGCNVRVGVRNNEIMRLEPRNNPNVNEYWMCDYGRLSTYHAVNEERLEGPRMKDTNALAQPTDSDTAARRVAQELAKYKKDEVLLLGSARMPIEDNYLMLKLAKEKFGRIAIPFIPHISGVDERLLLRADKLPNAMGATLMGCVADGHYQHTRGEKEAHTTVLELLRSRKIKAVVALGGNFLADGALLEAFEDVEFFATCSSNDNVTSRRADVVFSTSQWAERDGVFVNFEGWAQLLRPAVATKYYMRGRDQLHMSRLDRFGSQFDKWARSNKRDAREAWRSVQKIAAELGDHWKYQHTEDIFDEIAATNPEFKGLSYDSLGEMGQPVASNHEKVVQANYEEVAQASTQRIESVGSVIL